MSSLSHLAMGDGAEFDAIRLLLATWGNAAVGIGDDAAVLACPPGEQMVISTDATVENVHFRRDWLSSEEIGGRATAAALSDLAAMAATPRGLLLALGLPDAWRGQLESLGRGVRGVAEACACPIIGGNITKASELSLTITVFGSTTHPLLRRGAQPGDIMYVTGALGGPASALRALYEGQQPVPAHRARFVSPMPRLREAQWLAGQGAHAAIDISDGLVADAGQLARASAVTIDLDALKVPCVADVLPRSALTSGEEYELLVAMPGDLVVDTHAFAQRFGISLTHIGVATALSEGVVTVSGIRQERGGHDHLSA